MSDINQMFAALDGIHKAIAGTCETCEADVEFKKDEHGMNHMYIRHDDTCPTWVEIQARRSQ